MIRPAFALATAFGLAVASPGCGLGWIDDHPARDDLLPTRAAGPYAKLAPDRETPADEPYVVAVFPATVRDAATLPRDDGGYRLWFGHQDTPDGPTSEIWTAELPALGQDLDVEPQPALLADEDWEQGWVGEPSVVRMPDGDLVMFYRGGLDPPAIGLAHSSDDGGTWRKDSLNQELVGYTSPGAAGLPDGTWSIYATRADRVGIFHIRSADGASWQQDTEPVLMPRPGVAEAFDRDGIADPCISVRSTTGGDLHFSLFFSGLFDPGPDDDTRVSIGWAGSFDGSSFVRFASPDGPVLAPGGTSEAGPAVLLEPDRGVMFFTESHRGVQSVAVAVHP